MYQAMNLELGRMSEASRTRLVAEKSRMLAPLLAQLAPFMRRGELPRWSPALFDVVVLGAAHEGLRRWLAGAEELAPPVLRKKLPPLAWRAIAKSHRPVGEERRSPPTRSHGAQIDS